MSWKKLVFAGCFVVGSGIACSNGEDFETPAGGGSAGSDAGTDAPTGAKENGSECGASTDCGSGFCADGVCCDTACDGDCVACGLTGTEGVCTALIEGAQDTCADGECGGACDGKGACAYPGVTHSCGNSTCSSGVQSGEFCDGTGACKESTLDCGAYACGSNACRTSCTTSTECATGYHCDAGACVGKSANGGSCDVAGDCESGQCVDGVCCDVACAAPASCSTGTCTCGDDVCGAGEACITWYADTDNDGFGDPNATKAGCGNTAPSGAKYVKNSDDCYDGNVSAKPGQTAYFATHRGDGSFDYDCSGANEKQYENVTGLSCGKCGSKFGQNCIKCGNTFLGSPQTYMGFGCSLDDCSQAKPFQGFKSEVACGANGTLFSCALTSCSTAETSATAQQACR